MSYKDKDKLRDDVDNLDEGETHDMKNAEAKSIASVAKAEDGVKKKAPARKGDKSNSQPSELPKTKAGMVNAGYQKMASMNSEDLAELLRHIDGSELSESDAEGDVLESSYDFSADLDALVESENTLSDEFKAKTAVIFETAIKSKVSAEVSRLEEDYQTRLDEELESTRSDLVEKVDSYLNYVVEQWMEENKLAVEAGIRTEIAETFMNQLKDLFVESYIDVPESKINLVDELAESVTELEEKLNAQTGSVIAMTMQLESYKREAIINESSSDLASTEVEKLKSLVESLDFEDEASFASKVKTVKQSYFKREVKESITEEADDDWGKDLTEEVNSTMSSYLNQIRKSNK